LPKITEGIKKDRGPDVLTLCADLRHIYLFRKVHIKPKQGMGEWDALK